MSPSAPGPKRRISRQRIRFAGLESVSPASVGGTGTGRHAGPGSPGSQVAQTVSAHLPPQTNGRVGARYEPLRRPYRESELNPMSDLQSNDGEIAVDGGPAVESPERNSLHASLSRE